MTRALLHGLPKIPTSVRQCTDTYANKALGSLVVGHFQRVKKPDMFVSILASEAANLALKILATGGVYLAVDIPMRILKVLLTPRFMESFKRKGRLSELMERIPIHVVIARVALIGAAARGLEKFKKETP
jgi:glucokinase